MILLAYSLPTKEINIKKQELALRRFAPQRLIFHWEGSSLVVEDGDRLTSQAFPELNLTENQIFKTGLPN